MTPGAVKRIRVSGIVKLAQQVRRELSGEISPEQLAQLRRFVREHLASLDRSLAEKGLTIDAAPAPSRQAYRYLASVDFDAVATTQSQQRRRYRPGTVIFRGLSRYLEGILDEVALAGDAEALAKAFDSICSSSRHVEADIAASDIRPDDLKPNSRAIRGWLGFFARRDNFDAYAAALRRARPAFENTLARRKELTRPAIIHFRPMRGLWRIRPARDGTRVVLCPPMISFSSRTFRHLAALGCGTSRDRRPIIEQILGETYQAILADMEACCGIVDDPRGIHHELGSAFGRVNDAYFGRSMPRPRLTWSGNFSMRKFGHYDFVHDTVMVSSTLDRGDVPDSAVDFVIYHELLHKKHGLRWHRTRRAVHPAGFLAEERRFGQYEKATAVLRRLAGEKAGKTTAALSAQTGASAAARLSAGPRGRGGG